MPPKPGSTGGVIVSWGNVVLQPLDAGDIQQLASGKTVGKGFLTDFLGNFKKSAEVGLPVYLLSGGAGTVWSATYDELGRGNLRLTIVDASLFSSGSGSSSSSKDGPISNGPAFDPSQFGNAVSVVGASDAVSPGVFQKPPAPTSQTTPSGPQITLAPVAPKQVPASTQSATIAVGSVQAIRTVVAQGVGLDVESAAKNAAENALTEVVGTFVEADTILSKRTEITGGIKQESRSIDTHIKEYSQGSIKSFQILDSSNDNGLFRMNARVEVRVEDFKAFVMKLAEGETKIDVGIFAQAATRTKNQENAADMIINNILKPIITGEAIEITLGRPQLFVDWKKSQDLTSIESYARMLVQRAGYNTKSNTALVVPLTFSLSKEFLQNTRQILESISFAKGRLNGSHFQNSCPHDNGDAIMSLLPISDSFLGDCYSIKDVKNSSSFTSFFETACRGGPCSITTSDLIVSMKDSNDVIGEYLMSRGYGDSSKDGSFVMDGWGNVLNAGGAINIIPILNRVVFLNISPDIFARTKSISVKLVPK